MLIILLSEFKLLSNQYLFLIVFNGKYSGMSGV